MKLADKYRPNKLNKVFGNSEVINSLTNLAKKKEIPQVILFTGPTGTGKTTLARILANTLGTTQDLMNLIEMDSAQFTGIDVIRDIRKKSRYIPSGGRSKVFIMDEVHMISSAAQEGFLKELEEPPTNVYYFLCTTNPEKLKPTLKRRCSNYQLELLSNEDMQDLLNYVVKKEKEELHKKVYKSIVSNAKGHPGIALNILEQVLSVSDKKRLKIAENYEQEESESILLCRSLLNKEGFKSAQIILKGLQNQNAETIRRHVLSYCQSVLLGNNWKGSHQAAAQMIEEFSEPTYNNGFVQIVSACFAYYYSD